MKKHPSRGVTIDLGEYVMSNLKIAFTDSIQQELKVPCAVLMRHSLLSTDSANGNAHMTIDDFKSSCSLMKMSNTDVAALLYKIIGITINWKEKGQEWHSKVLTQFRLHRDNETKQGEIQYSVPKSLRNELASMNQTKLLAHLNSIIERKIV